MVTRIVVAALFLGSCAVPSAEVAGVRSEPRFFVEAISFRAHNETGVLEAGSDEVVAVFDTADYRLITTKYGDVDSGETRSFSSGQNCIQPATDPGGHDHNWTCIEAGTRAPLAFTLALYEHDGERFPPFGFCIPAQALSDVLPPSATRCLVDSKYAQLIGRMKVTLNEQQLVNLMPRAGDTHTASVSLFGGCDGTESPCVAGGTFGPSPDYTLTYRVTRVGSRVVEPSVDPMPR